MLNKHRDIHAMLRLLGGNLTSMEKVELSHNLPLFAHGVGEEDYLGDPYLLGKFILIFLIFRITPCSDRVAFFVSLSISFRMITFRLTFGFGYKFFEWMPFALNLCYCFRQGQFRLVYTLFKVPQSH
jgi:hypothetical protein